MTKSYEQMHAGLFWARGKAAEHPCVSCSNPAAHWAYLHTAGDAELYSCKGSPYSENFDDYAPMCNSCHRKFDLANSPELVAAFRAVGQMSPKDREQHRQNSVKGGRLGGLAVTKMRRRCSECPLISHPSGMANHQRASGHQGWVELRAVGPASQNVRSAELG